MIKQIVAILMFVTSVARAQQYTDLLQIRKDGSFQLSEKGIARFTKISLQCTSQEYPHDYMSYRIKNIESAEDLKTPKQINPSFYGCFDWHSGVHNHWALVKMLKNYPKSPGAAAIRAKLNESFDAKKIQAETEYFLKSGFDNNFEFPYGMAWLLKVADELNGWDDADAKKWLANLKPLHSILAQFMYYVYPQINARKTGDHYSSALGVMFTYDYAVSFQNDSLKRNMVEFAKMHYGKLKNYPFAKEPVDYDFMSGGLLIAEAMRRILPAAEFEKWIKEFCPDFFTKEGIEKVFYIKEEEKHDEYESHWDGFHLNRIWCMNGIMQALDKSPLMTADIRKLWRKKQQDMWNYSQKSIGVGNYDIDHWLSSFSVYACEGN